MTKIYDKIFQAAAEKHLSEWSYDWRMLKAQCWQESHFDPEAVSPVGAKGLMQFMADTWMEWAPKVGYVGMSRTDPMASINVGAAYMNHLMHQWYWPRPPIDRLCLALASYNAGLGNVLKSQRLSGNRSLYADIIAPLADVTGRKNSQQTWVYARKILYRHAQLVTG